MRGFKRLLRGSHKCLRRSERLKGSRGLCGSFIDYQGFQEASEGVCEAFDGVCGDFGGLLRDLRGL